MMRRLSLREVFQISRDHLLRQGMRAMSYNGPGAQQPPRCVFHGLGGLKCAVGVLIPESHYYPGLEHEPLEEVGLVKSRLRDALDAGGVNVLEPGMQTLLKRLQLIHDLELLAGVTALDEDNGWSGQLRRLAVELENLLGRFEEYEDYYPVAPLGA